MNYNKILSTMTNKEPGPLAYIIAIILIFGFAFGIVCLQAWIAMLLWNWVLVDYLAIMPRMEFWPMWGLVELCSILFKTNNFGSNKSDD